MKQLFKNLVVFAAVLVPLQLAFGHLSFVVGAMCAIVAGCAADATFPAHKD